MLWLTPYEVFLEPVVEVFAFLFKYRNSQDRYNHNNANVGQEHRRPRAGKSQECLLEKLEYRCEWIEAPEPKEVLWDHGKRVHDGGRVKPDDEEGLYKEIDVAETDVEGGRQQA